MRKTINIEDLVIILNNFTFDEKLYSVKFDFTLYNEVLNNSIDVTMEYRDIHEKFKETLHIYFGDYDDSEIFTIYDFDKDTIKIINDLNLDNIDYGYDLDIDITIDFDDDFYDEISHLL